MYTNIRSHSDEGMSDESSVQEVADAMKLLKINNVME